jgi:phosphatidylglycerophosphate synthase
VKHFIHLSLSVAFFAALFILFAYNANLGFLLFSVAIAANGLVAIFRCRITLRSRRNPPSTFTGPEAIYLGLLYLLFGIIGSLLTLGNLYPSHFGIGGH